MTKQSRFPQLPPLLAFGFILLAACAKSKDKSSPVPAAPSPSDPIATQLETRETEIRTGPRAEQTATFSYWFIQNGCSTEKQTFSSKEAMCDGLKSATINKNCASDLRKMKFEALKCPGDFSVAAPAPTAPIPQPEAAAPSTLPAGAPAPVRCRGHVSGHTGEKKIEEVIHWDRKTVQKVILSRFQDPKDAGEFSVVLVPEEAGPSTIKIFGWFIDNSKNQIAQGTLDSKVRFIHKDSTLNGRDVEITCEAETLEPNAIAPNDENIEMSCLGVYGPIEGAKNTLSSRFTWDRKATLTETVQIMKDGKNEPSNLEVVVDTDTSSSLPRLRVKGKAIDGHVEVEAESVGRLHVNLDYISAWDTRHVSLYCLPVKEWQESLRKSAEAMKRQRDENAK